MEDFVRHANFDILLCKVLNLLDLSISLHKILDTLEYYEDMKAIEKSNRESKGKPTYTLKEVCEMSSVDYEKL